MRSRLPIFLLSLLALPTAAQEQNAILSLTAASTRLQTGQEYAVDIRIDGAPEFWLADVEISYDPELLYVMGTRAGLRCRLALFAGAGTVVARNVVQSGSVIYTVSRAGEVPPAPGSGVIGAFRIYPIAPGQAELRFTSAAIHRLNDAQDGTVPVPFTAVLLQVEVAGDPVEPPSEVTATPAPTDTPVRSEVGIPTRAVEPTLVNVTAAPSPAATQAGPADTGPAGPSTLLIVAILVMIVGGVGLLAVLLMWRRSRRR
jgi:hypothetical protein